MSKPSSSMDKPTTYLLLPSRPHDPHLLVFIPSIHSVCSG